ncbi:MAG: hypothetical protein GXY84_03590 [Clostridiales bacterium]|nr:hypothetical protein [Clostridiales bacterium]
MPVSSLILLIFLFVGVGYLRRLAAMQRQVRQQQARRAQSGQPRPQTPPTPFQEAVPVQHQTAPVQQSLESKEALYRERWEDQPAPIPPAPPPPRRPAPPSQQPVPRQGDILPRFNRHTLVQAVIAKEILSRPPRAIQRPLPRQGSVIRPR